MDLSRRIPSSAEHQRSGVVIKREQVRIFGRRTVIGRHAVEAFVIELDQNDPPAVGFELRAFRGGGLVTDLDYVVLEHGTIETQLNGQSAALLGGKRISPRNQL